MAKQEGATIPNRLMEYKITEQTAVEWYFEKIKSHFEHDGDLLEVATMTMELAKQKERQQHGRTWCAAIEKHEQRGRVISRSLCDFDDYLIK